MRKIILQLFCIACTLNVMAQKGKGSDKDIYFNQTTLQVTKAGTLEQAFADASPEKHQGLQVIGPLN
ncbi:MAG: leucine-rich repeat domain-containing protein, partial [Prevotella sp.]